MTHLLESFGVRYSIELPAGAAVRWRGALPPGARTLGRRSNLAPLRRYRIERAAGSYALFVDEELAGDSLDARALADLLEGDVALLVAAQAPEHVFVHAGVVAVAGRALLLPGRTMTGKSTLVASLLAAGATYYSDEYAVLDGEGRVHPYPRLLSMRQKRGRPRRVLAPRRGRRALTVGWVVGAGYDGGPLPLTLSSLSAGRTALLLLLDNTVGARVAPARVLEVLRRVTAGAAGYVGRRGEARQAARALLRHCKLSDDMLRKSPSVDSLEEG